MVHQKADAAGSSAGARTELNVPIDRQSRTTGCGERLSSARSHLWCSVDRFQHGQGIGEKHLWRLTIADALNDDAFKIDADASPELLRKMARWFEKAAGIVERDGVLEKTKRAA